MADNNISDTISSTKNLTNIEKMCNSNDKSIKVFGDTIKTLKNSQGFYSRMYYNINDMEDDSFAELCETIAEQKFNDTLDVVFYLED